LPCGVVAAADCGCAGQYPGGLCPALVARSGPRRAARLSMDGEQRAHKILGCYPPAPSQPAQPPRRASDSTGGQLPRQCRHAHPEGLARAALPARGPAGARRDAAHRSSASAAATSGCGGGGESWGGGAASQTVGHHCAAGGPDGRGASGGSRCSHDPESLAGLGRPSTRGAAQAH
jgi:hypothetical protein